MPVWLIACAGGLAAVLTAAQIRLSGVLRLAAQPRQDRWHRKPTPTSGGLAIFCACAIVYAVFLRGAHVSIALGAAAVWALGLVDDRLRLRPAFKLLGQAAIAAAVIANGLVFAATASHACNVLFSFLWLVGITNAFNLIDNMDGLCAGVTVIICGFRFGLLAANGYWADANLCAVLGAAFAGFLVFNYGPARIFMGDCGSMLAGFSLAALAIASPLAHTKAFVAGVFYPALTFTYPIFDTVLVSVLRKVAGRPISAGGRDHSSHRLVSLGLSERRVVWILWGLTALGSAVGLMAHRMPAEMLAAAALLGGALVMFGIFLATLPAYPLPSIPSLRGKMILLVDALIAGVALFSAFVARFGSGLPADQLHNLMLSLPLVMLGHAAAGSVHRTYAISWRQAGWGDVLALARAAVIGAGCAFLCVWMLNLRSYSRGIMALYLLFCVLASVLLRSSLRLFGAALCPPKVARAKARRSRVLPAWPSRESQGKRAISSLPEGRPGAPADRRSTARAPAARHPAP